MVIFDWDGTLCDSAAHIVSALQASALEMGLPVPSDAAASNIIGLGLPQALSLLFPDAPDELHGDIASAYARHFADDEGLPPQLFPGAIDTLEALKKRGFEVAVATGKSRRGLDRVLHVFGLDGFFHATRCADETRSKPHPLMVTEILLERGASSDHAIMVGDTEYDLEMATNAGVASVGVSFGVHSRVRLQSHGPLAIVDTLPALLDLPCLARAR